MKMIIKRRLGLSHLRELKSKHGLQNTPNPLSFCRNAAKTETQEFLRYHFCNWSWTTVWMICKIFPFSILRLVKNPKSLVLYGNDTFDDTKNQSILISTIKFFMVASQNFRRLSLSHLFSCSYVVIFVSLLSCWRTFVSQR